MQMSKKKKTETFLNEDFLEYDGYKGAVVPPIFQNSLFAFESWDGIDEAFDNFSDSYIYSRINNPTSSIVEEKIAALCNGEKAKLTASGISAIAMAVLHLLKSGDHIITVSNVYGPANNFLGKYLKKFNIETQYVKGTKVEDFERAIRPNTKLIYLESPASMTYELQDIKAIAKLAKSQGIYTIIDNTWATPLYQRPLDMGIDIEVHSISKYLAGHSDIIAGVLIGKRALINDIIANEVALLGPKIAPFEAWLILRSLRTFPMRMEKHALNTSKVIDYLLRHKKIKKVIYPGLKSFAQHKLAKKQMQGFSGLFSIELNTTELRKVKKFVNGLNLFKLGVSWGGHESLVYSPSISYVKELPPDKFKAMGIKIGLVRLSIGLEHYKDQIKDLKQALSRI